MRSIDNCKKQFKMILQVKLSTLRKQWQSLFRVNLFHLPSRSALIQFWTCSLRIAIQLMHMQFFDPPAIFLQLQMTDAVPNIYDKLALVTSVTCQVWERQLSSIEAAVWTSLYESLCPVYMGLQIYLNVPYIETMSGHQLLQDSHMNLATGA